MRIIDDDWIETNVKKFIKKRVVILTGAGISVSSGIPDFRSKTGIFNDIRKKYKIKGSDLFTYKFSIEKDTRSIYLKYITELKELIGKSEPSITHKFFKNFSDTSKTFRVYTQNIDGLEEKGKVKCSKDPDTELVYLHGNLKNLLCLYCRYEVCFDDEKLLSWKEGKDIECGNCLESKRTLNLRKKNINYLHTGIIHYFQEHPDSHFISKCIKKDSKCNLFIVVGTSMNVFGVMNMVKYFTGLESTKDNCIYININKPNKSVQNMFDYGYLGTSDNFFSKIKRSLDLYNIKNKLKRVSISLEDVSQPKTKISKPNSLDKTLIYKKMKRLSLTKEEISSSFLILNEERVIQENVMKKRLSYSPLIKKSNLK